MRAPLVAFRAPPGLIAHMRVCAGERRVTLSELIRQALEGHILRDLRGADQRLHSRKGD
jgi:hypothetical protein